MKAILFTVLLAFSLFSCSPSDPIAEVKTLCEQGEFERAIEIVKASTTSAEEDERYTAFYKYKFIYHLENLEDSLAFDLMGVFFEFYPDAFDNEEVDEAMWRRGKAEE